jgi:hypothetical protein
MRTLERPAADAEVGHLATMSAHLANVAFRTGRKLIWDAEKETIAGDPAATALFDKRVPKALSVAVDLMRYRYIGKSRKAHVRPGSPLKRNRSLGPIAIDRVSNTEHIKLGTIGVRILRAHFKFVHDRHPLPSF